MRQMTIEEIESAIKREEENLDLLKDE